MVMKVVKSGKFFALIRKEDGYCIADGYQRPDSAVMASRCYDDKTLDTKNLHTMLKYGLSRKLYDEAFWGVLV